MLHDGTTVVTLEKMFPAFQHRTGVTIGVVAANRHKFASPV